MSNLEKKLHYKPPVHFYHEQNQQEIDFVKCHDNNEGTLNTTKGDTFLNGSSIIKTEIHKNPYCSESEEISAPAPNTILITNNKSSSSITIVTTHNSSGSLSATATSQNGTPIESTSGECMTGPYHKSLSSHSNSNSPVVLEGINILINNHFNEPSSSSVISNRSKSIDMDQKKHIKSTSVTVEETEIIKSEKSDIQTEPDSTTSGLSPDKSLISKNSNSNSDTGFGSSSSSSFCSSNSSNSSCISNESTNNTFKKQKIYNFSTHMDVLVQKSDGKFYLGIIKDLYSVDGKCLISFDDSSEYLADFDDIKRLGSDSEVVSSPMCVVCKKYNQNDVVELCEKCSRGYHRICVEGGNKLGVWTCKMCSTENGSTTTEKKRLCLSLGPLKKHTVVTNFSYNIKDLTWDNKHRINNEQMYCYCGKHGQWDNKMLQCLTCLQWFHEKCLKCLSHPLLYGDRFYIFVCSVCNHGTEIVRRLKINWVTLVHLILFNITKLENDKRYHHITKVITPYAINNWAKFQLSVSMNNLSNKEIQKKIMNVLSKCNRFKSNAGTKRSQVYWGLRIRIAPAAPKILIPKCATRITDEFLESVLKLKFLLPPKKFKKPFLESEEEPFVDNDSKLSSDLKFSSEDEIPIKNIIKKELGTLKIENIEIETKADSLLESQEYLQKEQSRRKKKHTFHPRLPNSLTFDKMDINNVVNLNNNNNNNNNLSNNNRIEKSVISNADMNLCCDSSDDNSSLGPLDLRIPPPKNFFGRNNPFRQITPKKNEEDYYNKNQNISSQNKKYNVTALSATKFNFNTTLNRNKSFLNDKNKSIDLSSKLVALKKSSVNLFNGGLPSDFQAAGQFRIVRTIKRRLSAKDLVIGPNQEIKRRRIRRSSGSGNVEVISTSIQSVSSSSKSKNNIIATYPAGTSFNFNSMQNLNKTSVLNISQSVLAYSGQSSINSAAISNASSSATSPTSIDVKNPFSNFANTAVAQQLQKYRSLRKRDDKNYAENRRNSNSTSNNNLTLLSNSTETSTSNNFVSNNINYNNNNYNHNNNNGNNINIYNNKNDNRCNIINGKSNRHNCYEQSTEDELSDLQSSVNMYFGAVQRIRNGEKFIVRGKRTLDNGKVQYLMEWEGCPQIDQ